MSSNPTTDVEIAPRTSVLPAWLRAMRPKQWVKNILVVSAPLAAGRLFEPDVALRTGLAFAAFVLVSAAIYLLNDTRDAAEDRLHPKKRFRPIAAGELSPNVAVVMAVVCLAASLALAFWTSVGLGIVIAFYFVLQLAYSLFLKHQPILDLAVVAAGFLLRALAGAEATRIFASQWFLLVAAFGSLFMVAGKRYSEMVALGAEAGTRKSLEEYSASYLRFVWMLSCGAVIMSYSLWAFEHRGDGPGGTSWTALSIVPFVLALLRYAFEIDRGEAGEPEDVVMGDHVLQAFGLVWLILVAVAVFL